MINKNIIEFKSGTLLTKEMLQSMYDYPIDILNCLYSSYSNGILSGFDVIKRDEEYYITSGLIKIDNCIYIMKEDFKLNTLFCNLEESTVYNIVFVQVFNGINENGVKKFSLEILLENMVNDKENIKFRFGSFKCGRDSKLELPRTVDSLFENNVLNLIKGDYAQNNESTYHPLIFRCILGYLKDKKNKNMLDYLMINEISKNNVLTLQIMKIYIEEQGFSSENLDREELLQKFIESIKHNENKKETVKNENKDLETDEEEEDFMLY